MSREVPEAFQDTLDAFNRSQGPPTEIAVVWNDKAFKREVKKDAWGIPVYEYDGRWQVFAVPVSESTHPLARNSRTRKLLSRLPDDSGREGVLLFTWCERNEIGHDVGFLPLDTRLLDALIFADSFRDKQHFEKTIKNPELEREKRDIKTLQAIMGAGQQYWKGIDSLTISMNPDVRVGGDWRGAKARWR